MKQHSKQKLRCLLQKERDTRAKEQEFIQELLKDKKLLELENIRLKEELANVRGSILTKDKLSPKFLRITKNIDKSFKI